jgi:hypothetical protein
VRTTVAPHKKVKTPPREDLPDDLIDALERLAALHRNGELSDDEYKVAKARLLGGIR